MDKISELLLKNSNNDYKIFQKKLIPDTSYDFYGVKMAEIRNIANEIEKNESNKNLFLSKPKTYYEEIMIEGLLISKCKNFEIAINLLNNFLPKIDNWAICDSICTSMKIFNKNKEELKKYIESWIISPLTYTKRFAIVCLMDYYAKTEVNYILRLTCSLSNDKINKYYVDMALAWLYSVLLIYHKTEIINLLASKSLSTVVQNKTIQKARESFRIDEETKKSILLFKV